MGDPLFLIGCALYAMNRWLIKPNVEAALFDNWFNDALLIPCALPVMLLVHRWLGLRRHDLPPSGTEICGHVAGWAALFEVIGPWIFPHTTGDAADVVAYATGAAAAWWWWRRVGNEF